MGTGCGATRRRGKRRYWPPPAAGLGWRGVGHQQPGIRAIPVHWAGHERRLAHRVLGPVDRGHSPKSLSDSGPPESLSRQSRHPLGRRTP